MRHYMVDPDNEERLLKIPLRVVAEIKAEALAAAVQRVEAIEYDPDSGVDWNWDWDIDPTGMTRNPLVWIREAVAAIKKGEQ